MLNRPVWLQRREGSSLRGARFIIIHMLLHLYHNINTSIYLSIIYIKFIHLFIYSFFFTCAAKNSFMFFHKPTEDSSLFFLYHHHYLPTTTTTTYLHYRQQRMRFIFHPEPRDGCSSCSFIITNTLLDLQRASPAAFFLSLDYKLAACHNVSMEFLHYWTWDKNINSHAVK